MALEQDRVHASPTKAFFVSMLTRDITLDDCILDLVDNSIDGAWASAGARPSEVVLDDALGTFAINISLSRTSFSISDNCGGIDLEEAVDYAFTFGRKSSPDRHEAEYTVGVYGIGMKRAVFKLGNLIRIHSTYGDDGQRNAFEVPINVQEWASNDTGDWDFDLDEAEPANETGVTIEVTELSADVSQRFNAGSYERDLRALLSRDYMLPLMRGLRISVNGTPVVTQPLVWQQSQAFEPLRVSYLDGNVIVDIFAGMNAPPPDETVPDDPNKPDRISGWFIACNGRIILAADRTALTGWGTRTTWPNWHNQYNGFLGIVLFSAADPRELPMTTTKRSVDTSSGMYRRALVEMEKPTRAWIDYTNSRKSAREAAAELERQGEAKAITDIQPRPNFSPPLFDRKPRGEPPANVNYSVPRRRLTKLAGALGNSGMTYRDVGLRSFDYAYEQLVDEGE